MNVTARLFDFQVNGFAGVDFQSAALDTGLLARAAEALRQHRVGAIFATLVTETVEHLCHQFEVMERGREESASVRAMIVGYHLEGPWLNPAAGFRGAHPAEPMHAPSLAEFDRLQAAAGGNIRLVTLAPEWPGSPGFIGELRARGIQVSLGHTDANDAQIDAAIEAAARFCTHLGNGAPGLLPRHDNVIQRLLSRDELIASFIPDGIHLPPFVLRNFFRAKPLGKVLFTTDAMAGAGSRPGTYQIGRLQVEVGPDGISRQPGGEGFAGSTLTPDEGVRRISRYLQLTETEAVRLWSDVPMAEFGISRQPEQVVVA